MSTPRWASRLFDGIFPSGAVERERVRILRAERPQAATLPPEELSPGEVAVALETGSTLAHRDAKHAARLLKAQKKLVSTAATSQLAYQRLQAVSTDSRWAGHTRQLRVAQDRSEPATGGDAGFQEDFDPHRPLVAEWLLSLVEVLFVVVEVVFWYQVFNDDVEPDAGLFDAERMSAILLAVLIPVVGVWVARTIGKLAHRWVARYPGVQRTARLGTLFSGVTGVLALVAIAWLVFVRFSPDEQVFAGTSVPAVPMAVVFVLVLLIDTVARTFLTSEIRVQSNARARHFDRLAKRLIAQNAAHDRAWLGLRSAIQVELDRCERFGVVGGLLVLDERAVGGRGGHPLTGVTERDAHTTSAEPGLALPDPTQQRLFGAPVALAPLRTIYDAVNSLDTFRPLTKDEVNRAITRLRLELHGTSTTTAVPPAANGTGPTLPAPDPGGPERGRSRL
ncbi:hypothetical protein [Micromonospora thermarum]|uniref:Uncharacterized protein n=1 Tax=Micromonospora thermarum TaxID=2720024 RepID=A0ABX0Z941_9ACTN|nr:hypothetical protein [Micromonospora thermarum]NJP33757.1 hypothetical protein [Micromonospora thermarum]